MLLARRRTIASLARLVVPFALLLLIAPLVGAQGAVQQEPLPPPGTAPPFGLYLSSGYPPTPGAIGYTAINPLTLADLPGAVVPPMVNQGVTLFSRDGSTAAGSDRGDIVIWDLRTGRERTHFYPDAAVSPVALSDDGSRLVAELITRSPDATLHPGMWQVFDTARGEMLVTIPGEPPEADRVLVDPVGWRLYRLDTGYARSPAALPPARIRVDDLTTGQEIGQISLPGMVAGQWPSNERVQGESVGVEDEPGFALSPDGRQLAVVHPARDAVTLIDTRTLRIERTVELGQATSLGQRLVRLLPFWPQTAAAKGDEGTFRRAVFATDGRHLYVTGDRYTMVHGQMIVQRLGLTVVDLARGTISKPVLASEAIVDILPAPDGRSIYAAGDREPGQGGVDHSAILRLDATTLKPFAERSFPNARSLLLVPRVAAV